MSTTPPSRAARAWAFVRAHPLASALVTVGAVGGAAAGLWLPVGLDDLSPAVRMLGGAVCGAWLAMFPLGFRLFE
jgi:hypothetical protein